LEQVERHQHYELVRYERDGVPLYAEIYAPTTGDPRPWRAVVLVPGGFVGVNASHREAARRLAAAGFLVALPHLRGQGKSGGIITFGREDAHDVQRLAQALTQRGGRSDYAYVGISFGAAIALNAARNDPKVRGIAYVLGPTDLREQRAMLDRWGRTDKVKRWDTWVGGSPENCPECWNERDPLLHVYEVNAPLLILQAGQDPLIPVSQACRLANVRQLMGRPVRRVALDQNGQPWREPLIERHQCVLPLSQLGDWREDHLILFPDLPHRTNDTLWRLVIRALERWFS
jgi:dipeptidyl aminopeptidase/acylaminoacyl peptidase